MSWNAFVLENGFQPASQRSPERLLLLDQGEVRWSLHVSKERTELKLQRELTGATSHPLRLQIVAQSEPALEVGCLKTGFSRLDREVALICTASASQEASSLTPEEAGLHLDDDELRGHLLTLIRRGGWAFLDAKTMELACQVPDPEEATETMALFSALQEKLALWKSMPMALTLQRLLGEQEPSPSRYQLFAEVCKQLESGHLPSQLEGQITSLLQKIEAQHWSELGPLLLELNPVYFPADAAVALARACFALRVKPPSQILEHFLEFGSMRSLNSLGRELVRHLREGLELDSLSWTKKLKLSLYSDAVAKEWIDVLCSLDVDRPSKIYEVLFGNMQTLSVGLCDEIGRRFAQHLLEGASVSTSALEKLNLHEFSKLVSLEVAGAFSKMKPELLSPLFSELINALVRMPVEEQVIVLRCVLETLDPEPSIQKMREIFRSFRSLWKPNPELFRAFFAWCRRNTLPKGTDLLWAEVSVILLGGFPVWLEGAHVLADGGVVDASGELEQKVLSRLEANDHLDDETRLSIFQLLGKIGGRASLALLEEFLKGWFLPKEAKRAAKEALSQIETRSAIGGLGFPQEGGKLSFEPEDGE